MNIEPGRYFTINQPTTGIMFKTGVSNFAPIKINKTRECRALGSNQKSCLQLFVSQENKGSNGKQTYTAAGQSGSIKLNYTDNKSYNVNDDDGIDLVENITRTISKDVITESSLSNSVYDSNYLLTSTSTKYYELPDNIYTKVDSSGKAYKKSSDVNSNRNEVTTDIGISNLPVSFESYNNASISLQYSLPKNDNKSLMYKAFNAKNDYFGSNETNDLNIYLKDQKGELDNNEKELVKGSACAKLYGYGSSKYRNCRNSRVTNKAGNCYNAIKNKYTCDLTTCGKDKILCDNGECSDEYGQCSTKCEVVGTKYYDNTGTEVSKSKYEEVCSKKCVIKNGKYYGPTGNEVSEETYYSECPKTCTSVTTTSGRTYYYLNNSEIVSKEVYDKYHDEKCCTNCGKYKQCCPDTDMVCPDENGNCPIPGNRKIIYRTIDLANPFPALSGSGRKTGANWCVYNIQTKKTNCSNTGGLAEGNTIVYNHILNNRSTESKSIYKSQPLYSVTLNSKNINTIKSYNAKNQYNNATLICQGNTCKSKILRGTLGVSVSGKCSSGGYNNLKVCAES